MAVKRDPLLGLNPDQSGPKEKIQNGDPRSGKNRDQRSQAAEAGGSGPSLQQGPTGTKAGQVPPHEDLEKVSHTVQPLPEGVSDEGQLPAGEFDRAGKASYEKKPLKEAVIG